MTERRAGVPALLAAALLAGCGGGGGSGYLPLPERAEDTLPEGARIDVSALDLYPLDAGDRWLYDRHESGAADALVAREVIAGPDAQGYLTLRESDAARATDILTRAGPDGIEQADPLGTRSTMPGVAAALPVLLQYPMPFYAPGGVRRVLRQGEVLADLDGDGIGDSYQLEITQVFRGFETQTVLGQATDVAHFSNGLAFTLVYSTSNGAYTTTTREEAYLAPGLGLVRADRDASGSDGAVIVAPYTMLLREATLAPRS